MFRIENDTNNIIINYYTYANHPDTVYFDFCDDAILVSGYGSKITWKAVSGTLTVAVSRELKDRQQCEGVRISLKLDNIKFIKENSTQDTTIASLVFMDRFAGICVP